MEIRDPKALEEAGKRFIEKALNRCLSACRQGVSILQTGAFRSFLRAAARAEERGLGYGSRRCFSAAVIYSFIHGYDMVKTARFSLARPRWQWNQRRRSIPI